MNRQARSDVPTSKKNGHMPANALEKRERERENIQVGWGGVENKMGHKTEALDTHDGVFWP